MAKKKGTQKKQTKKEVWKSFTADEYQQAAKEMVHFSAKSVNSNTPAFGIRLDKSLNLDLPYVAASTMERTYVPMDYTKNVGKRATVVKQINAIRHQKSEQFQNIPQADIEAILACNQTLDLGYLSENSVGIRLRQIILQDANGNDVAATPLPCAGLSALINGRLDEEYETENPMDSEGNRKNVTRFIKRKRVYLGIGGANPQNVGLNVRAMQKTLIFKVPIANISPDMRQVLAIYYKGIPIKPNKKILSEFIRWQGQVLERNFKVKPSSLDISEKENDFLIKITRDFLINAEKKVNLLKKHIEKLPDKKICSAKLPFIQQALLDSSLRTMEWRREFSRKMYAEIKDTLVWVNHEQMALQNSHLDWLDVIEGVLR